MEEKIDYYNLIISAYIGVSNMDEYELKEYALIDIKKYLDNYVLLNPYNYNYDKALDKIKETSLKTKLQDSLIVLNEIGGYHELVLMIKHRIKELE